VAGNGESYEEFPRDAALARFDPADKKFVAMASVALGGATILDAPDSN